MKHAQVHRFGDCIAMFLSEGETVYMTPQDARKIAKALNACSRDVKAYKFGDGQFKTQEFALADTGYNGCGFKVERNPK